MKSDPPAPTSFGNRFRDWQLLSEGAEGVLYRVTDRWTGRVCALKVAKPSEQAKIGLVQEFRLLSHLRHPCLIESLDLVRDGDLLGHLLEYVPIVPSASIFETGGEDAVRSAFIQALRGVHYLHRQGWLHTDISPGNILVWQEGKTWRAKVADLGLAFNADEAEGIDPRGTVDTMAPEVARGEGVRPESDWFGLGATAVSWLDGSLWPEDMSSRDILREVAGLDKPLATRRRIEPELSDWIAAVTQPNPAKRHIPAWDQLRKNADAWGPNVLHGGIHGVDETQSALEAWVHEVPEGQVGAVVVKGRVGTGRRTLGRVLARDLVARGWVGLAEMSLSTVSDWLEEDEPDPVRLARELSRRYEGVDLVVSWLDEVGELEGRLYEALIASRAQSEGQQRTLVIKVERRDEKRAAWLKRLPWVRDEAWSGVHADALELIAGDLYAEETGLLEDTSGTPLSLEMGKRAFLSGREGVGGEVLESVENDTVLALEKMESKTRIALSVLGASGGPWTAEQLMALLEIEQSEWASVVAELRASLLVESVYSRGEEGLAVSDWLVRDVLTGRFAEEVSQDHAQTILDRLKTRGRSSEIPLVIACLSTGAFRNDLVQGVLRDGLQEGQYESVVNLYKAAEETEGFAVAAGAEIALRAAERLGKFDVQVELLERLLDYSESQKSKRTQDLANALFVAGQGAESISVARRGVEISEGAEQLEARLNYGNLAWQVGEYEVSDEVLSELRVVEGLTPETELDLLVSFGRSLASRGNIGKAEEVMASAPSELVSSDPQSLRLQAGLQISKGNLRKADELIKKAVLLSETAFDWKTYLEANLRRTSLVSAFGDMREARRISAEVETAAIALGTTRLKIFSSYYIARWLNEIGLVEESLLRAKQVHRLGVEQREEIYRSFGAGHMLQTAMDWGLSEIAEFGFHALKDTTYPTIEGNRIRKEAMRTFYDLNYIEALRLMNDARTYFWEKGYSDDALENEPIRIVAALMVNGREAAETDLRAFRKELRAREFYRLEPSLKILEFAIQGGTREECELMIDAVTSQLKLGLCLDFFKLAPVTLAATKEMSDPFLTNKIKGITHAFLTQLVTTIEDSEIRSRVGGTKHFGKILNLLS